MGPRRSGTTRIDVLDLEPGVRRLVESLVDGGEVTVERDGAPLGTLTFSPAVLTGTAHPAGRADSASAVPVAHERPDGLAPRDGVTVVVTVMRLSGEARLRLGDALGPDYLVLDFADAPDTADIVLSHPVSPQLLNRWRLMFPQARVIVTEILDPELGIDVPGPVGRLLDAGAQVYLPPRPVEKVAENLVAYLAAQERLQLEGGDGPAAGGFLMSGGDGRLSS